MLQAEGLVIIDARGFFCDPCDELKPIFHEVATEYAGQAKFCSRQHSFDRDIPISLRYDYPEQGEPSTPIEREIGTMEENEPTQSEEPMSACKEMMGGGDPASDCPM